MVVLSERVALPFSLEIPPKPDLRIGGAEGQGITGWGLHSEDEGNTGPFSEVASVLSPEISSTGDAQGLADGFQQLAKSAHFTSDLETGTGHGLQV